MGMKEGVNKEGMEEVIKVIEEETEAGRECLVTLSCPEPQDRGLGINQMVRDGVQD